MVGLVRSVVSEHGTVLFIAIRQNMLFFQKKTHAIGI